MIKNLLVAGGAGFIGVNFIRMMLKEHPEVNIINYDLLTYAGNLSSLTGCEDQENYKFLRGDICDRTLLLAAIRDNAVDGIINFAAESHVDRSITGPEIFIQTNIIGTLTLLQCAREAGIKRYLQVSTDEVYGSLGATGFFSEESRIMPNSPYSASKAGADHLVHAFHHTYGLNTVITRCSNNYGPYQFPEKMIPLCINNARANKPIPVYGDGMQVRDWLYVYDHCTALWLAFCHDDNGGEVFNVGGGNEVANLDLVQMILLILGKPKSMFNFVSDRLGHDRRYAIDASKSRNIIGWVPSVSFDEGLEKTVKWYIDNSKWLEQVTSGDYQDYYRRMYHHR